MIWELTDERNIYKQKYEILEASTQVWKLISSEY